MSTVVSVFDWLRTREFKKAMDVRGGRGKRGMTVARWERTYSFRLCVPGHSDGDSRGRPALHPIWPVAVVTEISSARTARHKLQAARTDALIGPREKRIAIRTGHARVFLHLVAGYHLLPFLFRFEFVGGFNRTRRIAIARRSLERSISDISDCGLSFRNFENDVSFQRFERKYIKTDLTWHSLERIRIRGNPINAWSFINILR